jgi:hypothetical protein
MAIASVEEYFALLEKTGLLDPDKLAEARAAANEGENVGAVAERLVAAGLLSPWQSAQLSEGRSDFFLGKYKLIRSLSRHQPGSVFLGEHVALKRLAALKVIVRDFEKDPQSLARFLEEARSLASLDHPNIVRSYSVDEQEGRFYIATEYIDGADLRAIVESQEPLECALAADHARQVAEGLHYGHGQGVVHGDLKPSVLLLNKQGVVKIANMGLSRLRDRGPRGKEKERRLLDSVDYLAPEQSMASAGLDHRADIYSLGCTLYFLLTGRPPFPEGLLHERLMRHQSMQPEPIDKFRSDVPKDLVEICRKMMAKKPDGRYQTAKEAGAALAKFRAPKRKAKPAPLKTGRRLAEAAKEPAADVAAASVAPAPPILPSIQPVAPIAAGRRPTPRLPRLPRKNVMLAVAGAVGLLLLVVLGILVFGLGKKEPTESGELVGTLAAGAPEATPADAAAPTPVPDATPSPEPAPGGETSFTIPAWAFDRGNVKTFTEGQWVDAGPMVASGEELPTVVEYDIDFPVDTDCTISLQYASRDARPVAVSFDKKEIGPGCRKGTGGDKTSKAKWEDVRTQNIRKGRHTLRFERDKNFPHLIALRFDSLVPFPQGWKPDRPTARKLEAAPKATPDQAEITAGGEAAAPGGAVEPAGAPLAIGQEATGADAAASSQQPPGIAPESIDPFAALARSGGLELPAAEAAQPTISSLGKLDLPPDALVDVQLLGGKDAVRGPRQFVLQRDKSNTYWQIDLESESRPGGAAERIPIARVCVNDQQLFFQWAQGVDPARANCLFNCGLKICVDGESRFLPLAAPQQVKPVPVNLDTGIGRTAFPADRLPEAETLRLQIVRLDGGFPTPEFKPRNSVEPGGAIDISFPAKEFPKFWLHLAFETKARTVGVEVSTHVDYEMTGMSPRTFRAKDADQVMATLVQEEQKMAAQFEKFDPKDKNGKKDLGDKLQLVRDKIARLKKLAQLYADLKGRGGAIQFRLATALDDGRQLVLAKSFEADLDATDSHDKQPDSSRASSP